MVEGEYLRVFGAVAMDPIETTTLVLPQLSTRPHLVEKRDGLGRRYFALRSWVRRSGTRGRKDDIYLGRLSPLQRLAVRQAIGDAWEQSDKFSANRHLRMLYAQTKEYRRGKAMLSVLAARAGYRLHGFKLRKKTMTTPASKTDQAAPAQVTDAGIQSGDQTPDVDPVEILRRGVTAMMDINADICRQGGWALMRRLRQNGRVATCADDRILDILTRLLAQQALLADNIALLDGRNLG